MPENSSLNARLILVGAGCLLAGFLAGFFLANNINRGEHERLSAEVATLRAGGAGGTQNGAPQDGGPQNSAAGDDAPPQQTDKRLADALADALAKADASPADKELQRKVGEAFYFYALRSRDSSVLPDMARILRRAHDLDPKDHKTTVMAGDAQFLLARSKNDARALAEARKLYESALAAQPEDAVVRTSFGLTYFYATPPDAKRAISEYRRALQSDPRQEMSVQSLAAALIETGDFEEAGRRLDELEKLDPSNVELANLRAQLEQKRNAAKEGK
jgi:tetratricopeptide (TPR) repeat protein